VVLAEAMKRQNVGAARDWRINRRRLIGGVSEVATFAHVLATAAFCVINNEWVAEPGPYFLALSRSTCPKPRFPLN